MFICFLCAIVSVPSVHSFSPAMLSSPTTKTLMNSAATGLFPLPAGNNPLSNAFDSLASMLKPKDQGDFDEDKGAFGIALPMALASTASLGINANEMMDSFFQFATTGSFGVNFEAVALNDVSHLVSDILTIVAPALPCLPLRAAAIIGQLLSIAADYIPDHTVLPDEMIFQVIMLTMSWSAFLQVLCPKVKAATTLKTSYRVRDGKSYNALFRPTGMSWEQFKTLSANAMDWVDFEPHQEIPSGNDGYAYWLYNGSMDVKSREGKEMYTHVTTSGAKQLKEGAFMGLFGESALLNCLENKPAPGMFGVTATRFPAVPDAQARVGSTGATFLRIRTSQLKHLTDHDESLASSMRQLLFRGLSSKLAARMAQ